jgi:23S rRNA pseudouridine1911/1915/1917 synthase
VIENITFSNPKGGVRLDAALIMQVPTSTKSFIRHAIQNGDITIEGKRAVKGMKLKGSETIHISRLLEAKDNVVRPDDNVKVKCVFEDDHILAFDKRAGIPVQPLDCWELGTLMNGAVAKYPQLAAVGDLPLMAGALHRIDANTSGLVIAAKNQDAFNNLREQFSNQTVEKTYLALVEGDVAVGGTLENLLIHDPTLPFCRMIDVSKARVQINKEKAMRAVTSFKPIGRTQVECETRTLLEVKIFTGVTHQIRAQLANAGMHIINDTLYGAFAVENQTGHFLHALSAKFKHPISGDDVEIRTELPNWALI